MSDKELRERIRRRLKQLGRGAIEAAASVDGLERNYINDFVRAPPRKNSIKREHYPEVARALDWTVEQLLGERHDAINKTLTTEPWSNVEVPEFDIRAGAAYGGGFASEENISEDGQGTSEVLRASWGIPTPFLRSELGIQPGRVHILPVRGDSMTDALFDGDRAIIDLDDIDISQGGIFALIDDSGSVIIKQVEPVRGGERRMIRCKSRNPHYETFELHMIDPVRIVGRVACKITRL